MASIFKRLFSSGGAQAATAQMEEPPAELSATEKLLAEQGLGASPTEQPPSAEELNEFLIKNFLEDSSHGTAPPQGASLHAEKPAEQYPASSSETDVFAAGNPDPGAPDESRIMQAEVAPQSLAEIYGMPSGAVLADPT